MTHSGTVLPNLLIVGAQKCGTSWLYFALKKSRHFWGSTPKELDFWTQRKRDIDAYARHFENASPEAKFIFEATPHYFQRPKGRVNIAGNIYRGLGDIPLIVVLRDPVQRYLSAYTHHMMEGRLPKLAVLTEDSNDHGMLELGRYASILNYYDRFFSDIKVYLYDDLEADKHRFLARVFSDLDLECDVPPSKLNFRANDKRRKRIWNFTATLPRLSEELETKLRAYYAPQVDKLENRIGRDLSAWRQPKGEVSP